MDFLYGKHRKVLKIIYKNNSTVNRSELSILDPTFKSSNYIKSVSVTKDDVFGRYAKV